MATTNYAYKNYESLGDIANKFNTSTLNLVKLNKWLQDPNDGHTYMYPSKVPQYVYPKRDNGKTIGFGTTNSLDIAEKNRPYQVYRQNDLVVPIIGNGSSSIEDYWETVNDTTGISYNVFVDNLIVESQVIVSTSDYAGEDFILDGITGGNNSSSDSGSDSESGGGIIDGGTSGGGISGGNNTGGSTGNSGNTGGNTINGGIGGNVTNINGSLSSTLIPTNSQLIGSNVTFGNFAQLNPMTNHYTADFLGKYNSGGDTQTVDFAEGLVGNYIQGLISAGAANLNSAYASGLYRNSGSSKYSQSDIKTKDVKVITDKYGGPKVKFGSPTYAAVGDPDLVKGQCTVTVGSKTLYMPCYPESVKDGTEITYASQNALGRSEPYQGYENSGPRTIPFTFEMHREMTGNIGEIEEIVRWIESAAYPSYSGVVAPVKTTVKIGKSIYITGIMTNQSTNWSGPIGPDNKYNMVTVSFNVTEVTGNPKTHEKIISIGGYRA